jgi:hypothetical protein
MTVQPNDTAETPMMKDLEARYFAHCEPTPFDSVTVTLSAGSLLHTQFHAFVETL